LALSFGGRDEARLNAAVGGWLEREAKDDEWYVDALAVLENWSRQGIGTRLMRAAEQRARKRHYAKVALNVAVGNTEAENLYAHLGYVVTEQATLYGRPHARMVKTVEDGNQGTEGGT
jgi:ribosomal protein S18 acetylase RimI-like enzyme